MRHGTRDLRTRARHRDLATAERYHPVDAMSGRQHAAGSPVPDYRPSSASGRTSICRSSRPTRSWRASTPSWRKRSSGRPPVAVFRVCWSSRRSMAPTTTRRVELARSVGGVSRDWHRRALRHRARFYPAGSAQAARPVRDRRPLRRLEVLIDDRPCRTPASSGCRYLVSDPVMRTPFMAEQTDIQKDLMTLAADLKRLEAEYNMFFAGRLPRPPWETRGRVEALIKRWDRGARWVPAIGSGSRCCRRGSRSSSSSGIAACARAKKAGPAVRAAATEGASREEGRAPTARSCTSPRSRIPSREMDKLHSLYDSLMDARRSRARTRAVPQVRRAGEGSGHEAGDDRQPRGGVPGRVKDGKVNVYGAGNEGEEK